ncbi:MAG TPA: glycosyltransferase family 39 protein [Bryobacteraceae bacterium]|nr:glycosyltransferase family 39 protein [Bryobacteraceae bacterium]
MPRKHILAVIAFVLFLRLPFLNQAIQGDDYYYLAAAEHAQIDPAHPHHARYFFLGDLIDMRGHPHPPGNSWILASLLAAAGDIREPVFHAAYIVFSLIAALSMLWLAHRFVPRRALEATLLFCAVPAFVVNGTSFEADLPFLAFWMLSIVLTMKSAGDCRFAAAAVLSMVACSLIAYQSVLLIPLLAFWLWHEKQLRLWPLLLVPAVTLAGYQLFERLSSGNLPAQVLAGHFQTYGLQRLELKLRSAIALTGHLVVMLSPLAVWALIRRRQWFLTAWVAMFFAAALVLFFAGSARYLLPLAAPLAILLVFHFQDRPILIGAAFLWSLTIGLSLAWVNYQHWDAYRTAIRDARLPLPDGSTRRLWVNGEWGLRYYSEAAGAIPVARGGTLRPGDMLITSGLMSEVPFTLGGGVRVEQSSATVLPTLPLRLIGLGSRSGYSSIGFGLWPFDITTAPVDRISISSIVERAPTLSWLDMRMTSIEPQIVSGVYSVEEGQWRWSSPRAVFLLKAPGTAAPVRVNLYVPEQAPGRRVTVELNGSVIDQRTLSGPGMNEIVTAAQTPGSATATLVISIDRGFSPPGDGRTLGFILTGAGFQP